MKISQLFHPRPFFKERAPVLVPLVLLFLLISPFPVSAEPLLCGIDRLEKSGFRELGGMKVGLITNRAGVNRNGEADYAVMLKNGVKLQFLMAPEHGFSADIDAGRSVGNTTVEGRLPVYSLYGESKKPDERLLGSIDILLFDLQDVGARCYTYITTMKNAMEACEKRGTAFMVLDRPNPVIPIPAEGFMLIPGYGSFVGAVDVPFVHALTVGEIALLLKTRFYGRLDLRVVAMQGYRRDRFADEYPDFMFVSPSPNINNVDTAVLYPSLVFLEGTTVSEGRGTEFPFRQFGAPFIRSSELARELFSHRLPGVTVDTISFRPSTGKFRGELCHGLKLFVTERRAFSPFRTASAILLSLQKLYPGLLGLEKEGAFFDRIAGTPRFREMILQQASVGKIMEESALQTGQFKKSPALKMLYP
ncbi:MAG: DUF1343 domain-containing protein [Chlorobiaceae bacterium]|nr:DUF1343 domain-containing protein [Chlorobiaceae bacterium]